MSKKYQLSVEVLVPEHVRFYYAKTTKKNADTAQRLKGASLLKFMTSIGSDLEHLKHDTSEFAPIDAMAFNDGEIVVKS